MWVAPFGNPRITGYLLLPAAYRSLSRPSSAPDAKAFPLRPFQLDLSSEQSPFHSVSAFAKTALHSLAPPLPNETRFTGLSFGSGNRGTFGLLSRLVRENGSLKNYAGFTDC